MFMLFIACLQCGSELGHETKNRFKKTYTYVCVYQRMVDAGRLPRRIRVLLSCLLWVYLKHKANSRYVAGSLKKCNTYAIVQLGTHGPEKLQGRGGTHAWQARQAWDRFQNAQACAKHPKLHHDWQQQTLGIHVAFARHAKFMYERY